MLSSDKEELLKLYKPTAKRPAKKVNKPDLSLKRSIIPNITIIQDNKKVNSYTEANNTLPSFKIKTVRIRVKKQKEIVIRRKDHFSSL